MHKLFKSISSVVSLLNTCVKILLAYIVSKPFSQPRGYLVGSDYGEFADDNAVILAEYIAREGNIVHFVSNNKIKNLKTVARGEIKTFILFFRSKGVFFTHSLSDILPNAHKIPKLVNSLSKTRKVFIQHGVIGLKKDSGGISIRDYVRSVQKTSDYIVVSSESEGKIVNNFGVPLSKIKIVGLPRFDRLSISHREKGVLIFLTWTRDGNYQKRINEILNSEGIKLLISSGHTVNVKEHNMMLRERKSSSHSAKQGSLNKLVNESNLLITDDSSIAWDFLYREAKVIFYKPRNEWLIDQLDFNNMIVHDKRNLSRLIKQFINGQVIEPRPFAKYKDLNNCKRVFDLVETV